jgi:adenine-specific DNA-methyltransferase
MTAQHTESDLKQLDGQSMNLTEHNIEQLKQLFPNVFTEGKIDFDALKSELGAFTETENERYQFTWNGKEQAKRIATTPTLGTLRPAPEESVNWDSTENLYIEGDNLEVLKLLQKSYFGKVKMIYIDPPYNTGNDFVYKDDFKDNLTNYQRLTGQKDDEGNPLSTNKDSSGRYHSNWLSMMYPRLKLARNLLKDDGIIFISIDDHEIHNLRKVCDEIFGEGNFVANILWQKRTSPDARKNISAAHDHILVFAKKIEQTRLNFLPFDQERLKNFTNPDNDLRGVWASVDMTGQTGRAPLSQFYSIKSPNGKVYPPPEGRCWAMAESTFLGLIEDNRVWFGVNGDSRPRLKKFLSESEGTRPWTWWENKKVGHSQEGNKEVMELFNGKLLFDNPKPIRLLRQIIQLSTNTKGTNIVLDFFAGSGTTAHAIFEQNIDDDVERKFILVQLPEQIREGKSEFKSSGVAVKEGFVSIADISRERISRAAKKLKDEHPDTQADLGFKVFKLDTSNIKKWQPNLDDLETDLLSAVDNILPDRTSQDLLFEVLIKYGLPLTLPVQQVNLESNGKTYQAWSVASGALVACFDENITLETVQAIADLSTTDNPVLRVVFRDTSFTDDITKTNAIQRLKQSGIEDVLSI